jgi:eukaryotic translation initiation factor 2C
MLIYSFRFPVDENSTMKSVVEYFQEMYGFTIQYTHLPCLQVGNQKKANYLPMEVWKVPCNSSNYSIVLLFILVCLWFYRRAKLLKGNVIRKDWMRSKLLLYWKLLVRDPAIGKMTFYKPFNIMLMTKEFGINISEKLASVEARILPAPWVMCFSF